VPFSSSFDRGFERDAGWLVRDVCLSSVEANPVLGFPLGCSSPRTQASDVAANAYAPKKKRKRKTSVKLSQALPRRASEGQQGQGRSQPAGQFARGHGSAPPCRVLSMGQIRLRKTSSI
jgi:hypothetical protein